jgi:hypothetical protein
MEDKYEVVYRAAIKRNGKRWLYEEQRYVTGEYIQYSRPYSTPGPAKAVVTKARRKTTTGFVDGWVEVSIGWKALDED